MRVVVVVDLTLLRAVTSSFLPLLHNKLAQQGTSQRATTTRQQTVTYMFLPVEVVPYHTYLVPDFTIPYHIIPDLS